MEVFNNQQRSGYEEIASYGPKWWTEFREMDANYRFAGWTLDLMAYWMERVVNNQFPANADERTITTVFEPALGIEPEPDETLEERRKTVAAYWSGTRKLSKTVIQSIIKAYTGCESELWWNGIKLQIRIFCDEDEQFSQRKLHNIISRRYPAHLSFAIRDVICIFVLEEQIAYNRIRHRAQLTWWDGILNGSNALDGSTNLNHWYPTEFRPVYPFETVVTENFIADRIFHRIPDVYHENIFKPSFFVRSDFVWWEGFLDGNFSLDGTRKINSWYPMETFIGHRLFIGNQEAFETKQCISLPDMINAEKADFRGTQRVIMGWRDGNKILDGNCLLDGTLLLDAGEPPYLQTVRIRAPVKHEEEVEVTMVIPSRAARLDGTCRLDGSVKLNSGREVL